MHNEYNILFPKYFILITCT